MENDMYINDIIGIQTRIKHLLLTVGVSLDENFSRSYRSSERITLFQMQNYARQNMNSRNTK